MDVTDVIDYNYAILNPNDLTNSFFCLSKNDPEAGFPIDASTVTGSTYPATSTDSTGKLSVCLPRRIGRDSTDMNLRPLVIDCSRFYCGYAINHLVDTHRQDCQLESNPFDPLERHSLDGGMLRACSSPRAAFSSFSVFRSKTPLNPAVLLKRGANVQ